jgi:hypothetical protein
MIEEALRKWKCPDDLQSEVQDILWKYSHVLGGKKEEYVMASIPLTVFKPRIELMTTQPV